MKTEGFYVGIEDPVELRRNILESSKDIIHNLQRYERLLSIREQKKQAIDRLNKKLAEIRSAVTELKSQFPEIKPEPAEKTLVKKPVTRAKIVKKIKKKTELEKLNEELKEVEEKLGRLG